MTYTAIRKFEAAEKTSGDSLSRDELIIKAHLGQWIYDVQKQAELDQRLKEAFENSKSHTQSLSQM